jgi:CheY-like chemotaxis protein
MFKREADFEVCGEAENGQEAIEKAQQLHPDLVVMDLSMPVMNGIEAARVLQGLMPTVPLIVFSEYSDVFSENEARSAGVSALVPKSEHVSVLVGKARALLYDIAAWFLLLFPIRKPKVVPLENAQACEGIFNGLPFRSVIWVLRNGLKPVERSLFLPL